MGSLIILEDYMKREDAVSDPGRHCCEACERLGLNDMRAFFGGQEYRVDDGFLRLYKPGFIEKISEYSRRFRL